MGLGSIIRRNGLFLSLSLVFILLSLFLQLNFDKDSLHLWADQRHQPGLDKWVPYLTYLGDGFVFLFLGLVSIFFFDRKAFMITLFASLLTLFSTAGLKRAFNEDRPFKYFSDQGISLQEVPGVKSRYQHSFPSGHTTAAFAAWGLLAFFIRSSVAQVFFFAVALFTGFTRIYLNQHFLSDITAGAALGSFIMLCAVFLGSRLKSTWFDRTWFKWGNEVL